MGEVMNKAVVVKEDKKKEEEEHEQRQQHPNTVGVVEGAAPAAPPSTETTNEENGMVDGDPSVSSSVRADGRPNERGQQQRDGQQRQQQEQQQQQSQEGQQRQHADEGTRATDATTTIEVNGSASTHRMNEGTENRASGDGASSVGGIPPTGHRHQQDVTSHQPHVHNPLFVEVVAPAVDSQQQQHPQDIHHHLQEQQQQQHTQPPQHEHQQVHPPPPPPLPTTVAEAATAPVASGGALVPGAPPVEPKEDAAAAGSAQAATAVPAPVSVPTNAAGAAVPTPAPGMVTTEVAPQATSAAAAAAPAPPPPPPTHPSAPMVDASAPPYPAYPTTTTNPPLTTALTPDPLRGTIDVAAPVAAATVAPAPSDPATLPSVSTSVPNPVPAASAGAGPVPGPSTAARQGAPASTAAPSTAPPPATTIGHAPAAAAMVPPAAATTTSTTVPTPVFVPGSAAADIATTAAPPPPAFQDAVMTDATASDDVVAAAAAVAIAAVAASNAQHHDPRDHAGAAAAADAMQTPEVAAAVAAAAATAASGGGGGGGHGTTNTQQHPPAPAAVASPAAPPAPSLPCLPPAPAQVAHHRNGPQFTEAGRAGDGTFRGLAARDTLLLAGDGVRRHDAAIRDVKMNSLLEDWIYLQKILRKLDGEHAAPIERDTDPHIDAMVDRLIRFLKQGKPYELVGLKGVPTPFLNSSGRIFALVDSKADEIRELNDAEAKEILRKKLFDDLKKDDLNIRNVHESPFKELREMLQRSNKAEGGTKEGKPHKIVPAPRDALLLPVAGLNSTDNDGKSLDALLNAERLHESHAGNKVIFNLASQYVTIGTTETETRVEAALNILTGFDEAEIPSKPDEVPGTSKIPRFLVRSLSQTHSASAGVPGAAAAPSTTAGNAGHTDAVENDDVEVWEPLSGAEAAEFIVGFVFEVVLEKEIQLLPSSKPAAAVAAPPAAGSNGASVASGGASASAGRSESPCKIPVSDPTDHDVLFGRGGMTNSHPGNRRFRDIIALHRPDYIRAIKMDKPAVARKIVKAIRQGNPPGRFLKKGEDGLWYDVGDRTAAEKTSQGLRERSNAEKRQRSELRRALRIRKEDLQEDDNAPSAKKMKVEGVVTSPQLAAAALTPTLNYVGTNMGVPLSLTMNPVVPVAKKPKAENKVKPPGTSELQTEGLPPNAVDEEGNILVTDYDILCGRGGLTNHHRGNKRFRDIVALHRPDYVRAPKIQKPSVARVIVRAIRNGDPPGRFLRKDEKTGKWVDIGDKKAAEKTSQALREKTNDERDHKVAPPAGVGVLLPSPASYLATTTASVMGNILASTIQPPKPPPMEEKKESGPEESKHAQSEFKSEAKVNDGVPPAQTPIPQPQAPPPPPPATAAAQNIAVQAETTGAPSPAAAMHTESV